MKMKKITVPVGILVLLALALGSVLGTEDGRARRDSVLTRFGRGQAADDAEATDAAADKTEVSDDEASTEPA
jgi:hypothetical protein